MSLWVYELASLWVSEFVSWRVREFVCLWSGEYLWIDEFIRPRVCKQSRTPAVRLLPTTQQQQRKEVQGTFLTPLNIVAETRLEHVTSRLWAWRATNCSTPRCLFAPHFWIASAKVHIYPETHKLSANFLAEKNEFVNEKASFFAKQQP